MLSNVVRNTYSLAPLALFVHTTFARLFIQARNILCALLCFLLDANNFQDQSLFLISLRPFHMSAVSAQLIERAKSANLKVVGPIRLPTKVVA